MGKIDDEQTAFAGFAFHAYGAALSFNKRFGDWQALTACPALFLVGYTQLARLAKLPGGWCPRVYASERGLRKVVTNATRENC